MRTSRRCDLRGEQGITIVEAMIASAILLVVLLAGFLALESAQSANKSAERQAIAASIGEREIERLTNLPWSRIVHCQAPAQQVDPLAALGQVPENPLHYGVNGPTPRFRILANYRSATSGPLAGTPSAGEPLAVDSSQSCATAVNPGPVPFSSGGVTGSTYRFVTWRDDTCPPAVPAALQGLVNLGTSLLGDLLNTLLGVVGAQTSLFCASSYDSKRITVAVVLDDVAGVGPRKPTWLSTIHTNPSSGLILGANGQYDF